jgi:hypothetical protein
MADPNLNLVQANMQFLTEKRAYTPQANVVTEPDTQWAAQAIEAFSQNHEAPLVMDQKSQEIFEGGQAGNAFTALVETAQKKIYLFPLAANPEYGNTAYPKQEVQLPGNAGAGGATCAPLVHDPSAGAPSHQQLAHKLGKGETEGTFIGFAVKKRDDGAGEVTTVTSRSQNREAFKRKPTQDFKEQIEFALEKMRINREGREQQEQPGIMSEIPSENWTKLIVKSVVVSLRKRT